MYKYRPEPAGNGSVSRPLNQAAKAVFPFCAALILLFTPFRGVLAFPGFGGPLPEFTSSRARDWINSKPLRRSDLRGKVTLVYFWAFDCWNSYRSFPWLFQMEKRFAGAGFQAVGIHTPEFDHERSGKNLEAKIREFNITHPVMMDNDFRYWRKMGNRYWPAFYLVDRDGKIRHKMNGETHVGDGRAEEFERVLEGLINRR